MDERKNDSGSERGKRNTDLAGLSRTERKRCREKKRRSDVNRGFDSLTSVLMKIEHPQAMSEPSTSPASQDPGIGAHRCNNRVELISWSIKVLERLHKENEELKEKVGSGVEIKEGNSSIARGGRSFDDRKTNGMQNPQNHDHVSKENSQKQVTVLVPVVIPWGNSLPPPPTKNGQYHPMSISPVPPNSSFPMSTMGDPMSSRSAPFHNMHHFNPARIIRPDDPPSSLLTAYENERKRKENPALYGSRMDAMAAAASQHEMIGKKQSASSVGKRSRSYSASDVPVPSSK
mmetsp:Transcript_24608/g.36112  ORF Transcript_24608/g.36112 Transcript_24608/m.36112 type:complete len:289 (+) Transcript_24608:67-933(+)